MMNVDAATILLGIDGEVIGVAARIDDDGPFFFWKRDGEEAKLQAVATASKTLRDARGKAATIKAKRELAEALARLDA
jgi:hypothetical protein